MSKKEEILEDFLETDDAIRGQNYVCLSFVSPEKVLKNKEVFIQHHFLKKMAENYDLDQNQLEEKYKDFVYANGEQLEEIFYKENDFQTTVRGLKVRGVYDTLKEAQIRAKVLQRKDKNFNVFVGQVGYWLPWDPNPHKVDNQEYFESEMNNLVKKYKENQENKEIHFRENIEYVKEQASKKLEEEKKKALEDKLEEKLNPDLEDNVINSDIKKSLDSVDPWLANKNSTQESVNNVTENNSL